ncbi:FAD-dependent oxidoreductase [Nonomuraea antimicrobica]
MTSEGQTYDLVVVGGGPAGVAGALTAALAGLRVALVDSGTRPGGQYFRHTAEPEAAPGLDRFLRQARALAERADVLLRHQVWHVSREPDGDLLVHCSTRGEEGERAQPLRARRLLIATGAYDRSLPFPGWDLPGVLTAGVRRRCSRAVAWWRAGGSSSPAPGRSCCPSPRGWPGPGRGCSACTRPTAASAWPGIR